MEAIQTEHVLNVEVVHCQALIRMTRNVATGLFSILDELIC